MASKRSRCAVVNSGNPVIEVVDYDSDDSLPRPSRLTKKSKKQTALPDEILFRVEGSLASGSDLVQPADTQQDYSKAGDSQTLSPPDATQSAGIEDFDDTFLMPTNQESSDSADKKVSRMLPNQCALMLMHYFV